MVHVDLCHRHNLSRCLNRLVYKDDLEDIFNSRTFCLYEDIEAIENNGLAKGGSLENAIVVNENEILIIYLP